MPFSAQRSGEKKRQKQEMGGGRGGNKGEEGGIFVLGKDKRLSLERGTDIAHRKMAVYKGEILC